MDMEQVGGLVIRATSAPTRGERVDAYGRLVERFRDMACGYAYAIVGDFHLAEDVAQEAFIAAFDKLGQLRKPEAFPGWFRRIVRSECGRATRRKLLPAAGVEAAAQVASAASAPEEAAERKEMRDQVLRAIGGLSDPEREVTTLFYINGYSQKDIADFLEIPVGTVKNRLNASRSRLKERMLNMVKDTLHNSAPDERFDRKVIDELLAQPRPLTISGNPIRQVWEDFKACFPDSEVVDFAEVVSREATHLTQDLPRRMGYVVDEASILRTDLTDQLVRRWLEAGSGPGSLITAGRTFRKGAVREPRRAANLFHQAELLRAAAGLKDDSPMELARTVAIRVLGREPAAFGSLVDVGGGVMAREVSAPWRGKPLEFAVAGFHSEEVIRRGGLDPHKYRAVCLCLGLERCALIRYDLDDIRKLWQPPYVPSVPGEAAPDPP